ncbi:MAG: G8 domain-containing protein, partial [Planctomycetota bacterium]
GVEQTLTTDWIHVNSGGIFQIGSESDRYDQGDFTLTLTGTNPDADYTVETAMGSMQIMNNDGFLMAAGGGQLQFFGEEKLSFTKLASTANAGSSVIEVENVIERNFDGTTSAASDGVLDWRVGDRIVIASSTRDYNDEDVRVITAIQNLGTTTQIAVNAPLTHRHYGEIEAYDNGTREIDLRAEVALLDRNVVIQGLASQDTDNSFGDRARFNAGLSQGVGGHIMIMPTAGQVRMDGVQLDRMGQSGRLGRYPMHWHIAGDRTGDFIRNSSVTNSNNRGITIHGTHNVLLEGNVLHDIHGHGFFMEDAVENGNQYLSNITFGIHAVGQVNGNINLSDPFIVDTHDHVGQNSERFLSSAGYWMTNPANIWVGNISAGSEGTGFWFLFPDRAIGLSAQDPQYDNVRPDRTNLWTFDHNSSHSSPIGLNFDRGSDLEVPVGGQLKANFDGDEHRPSEEPQINYFTGYKHNTGVYHRGRIGNFHENKFADSGRGTFITFTQRITNALYVGHSRGNSDPSDLVAGHVFYDGANTLTGTHFAGFTANNAHMFRAHGAAQRLTHFVMSDTSFEDDGSANAVSFTNPGGGLNYDPVGKSFPSVVYDADGTFTGHVGGSAGSTIVGDHPFFYNSSDFRPSGWNARVTDDLYAMFRMREPVNNALFRVTSPDGETGQARPGTGQFNGTNTIMKMDDGDYSVTFPDGLNSISNGFDIKYNTLVGPGDGSTMVRFVGVADRVTVNNRPRVDNLEMLRQANSTSFAVDGFDVWVKFFSSSNEVDFVPGTNAPIAVDDSQQTDESTSVVIPVLSNDSGIGIQIAASAGSVVADYRDDFDDDGFPANWQYLWNGSSSFGNPSGYSAMSWDAWRYKSPASNFPYLTPTAAHPGDSAGENNAPTDRFAIAAYTVDVTGNYAIANSFINRSGTFGDGVEVAIHTTNSPVQQVASVGAASSGTFDTSLGFLPAGTTIYVGVGSDGPGEGSGKANDGVSWDFSIVREQSTTSTNGATLTTVGSTIVYVPGNLFEGLNAGEQIVDTFSYTISDINGQTDSATVSVVVNGVGTVTPLVRIEDVAVASTAWTPDFMAQLESESLGVGGYEVSTGTTQGVPLRWGNVDQVSLRFSDDLIVGANDVVLVGSQTGVVGVESFAFDADSHVATWTFADSLAADQYTMNLVTAVDTQGRFIDGEWLNGVSTASGDGLEGGLFSFAFNVLPGDSNGDGEVNLADFGALRSVFGTQNFAADFDGDTFVTLADFGILRTYFGQSLSSLDDSLFA